MHPAAVSVAIKTRPSLSSGSRLIS